MLAFPFRPITAGFRDMSASLCQPVRHARHTSEDALWASLAIVPGTADDEIAGAIIGVSHEALSALRNREVNYHLQDVTEQLDSWSGTASIAGRVSAFLPITVGKDICTASGTVYIRKEYYTSIQSVLERLGLPQLPSPEGFQISEAYLREEKIRRLIGTDAEEQLLNDVRASISSDTTHASTTRKIPHGLFPICISKPVFEKVCRVAESACRVAGSSLKFLSAHSELAAWVGYSEQDIELLKHSVRESDHRAQVVRVDLTLSGNRLLIFELNTDSPGGMYHSDTIASYQAEAIEKVVSLGWIEARRGATCDRVIEALIDRFPEHRAGTDSRRVKIVEYEPEKWATYPEMEYIRDRLIERGVETEILDLSKEDLHYSIDALRTSGDPSRIDLIYKRILWGDLAKSKPETKDALARAYLNNDVSVVNSLGSRVAGNKMLLALVKTPSFQAWAKRNDPSVAEEDVASFLSCLPSAMIWGDAPAIDWGDSELSRAAVLDEPSGFVMKGFHGFGGGEVLIGPDLKDARAIFEDRWNKGYIAQEYVPHGRSLTAVERGSEISWEQHRFILGAYVIGGRCIGVDAKTSPSLPINMSQGGFRTAVFAVR